jgi:riboflavin synthase
MFTGLIESLGTVRAVERRGGGARLSLQTHLADELALGESLSVNGCCLTVTERTGNAVVFDLLNETLIRTNLGDLGPGSFANLERALRADGRFGGHFVQGHVDTTARVLAADFADQDLQLQIELPRSGKPYLVEKGSIALNGVSLTVASLNEYCFELWIIPHTLRETNLGALKAGDRVNLEFDLLAKYTQRQLRL